MVERRLGNGRDLDIACRHQPYLHEGPRAKLRLRVGDSSFGTHDARFLIELRIELSNRCCKSLPGNGIRRERHRGADADRSRRRFRHFQAQPQRVGLDDLEDRGVFLDVLAGRDAALGHRGVKRRPHGGVGQTFFCEVEISSQGLDIGRQGPQIISGGVQRGLTRGHDLVEFRKALLRDISGLDQLCGRVIFRLRIRELRLRLADGRRSGRSDVDLVGSQANARQGLGEQRLGSIDLDLILARVEGRENLAFPHLLAEVGVNGCHPAGYFKTDRDGLIRQQLAGHENCPLHAAGFRLRRLQGDGFRWSSGSLHLFPLLIAASERQGEKNDDGKSHLLSFFKPFKKMSTICVITCSSEALLSGWRNNSRSMQCWPTMAQNV